MSDQKRWFKLWHSALSDDALMELPPALRWAWAALGTHTKVHGSRGRVVISLANSVLAAGMGVELGALKSTILALPHVHVEEGKPDNGKITVTWDNWSQYQEDSTVAERVRRLRSKRRGEEKRGEKEKEEISTPKPPPRAPRATQQPPQGFRQFVETYPKHRRVRQRVALKFWSEHKLEAASEKILSGLRSWIQSQDWQEQDGKFVPAMPKFLKEWRWEDRPQQSQPKLSVFDRTMKELSD